MKLNTKVWQVTCAGRGETDCWSLKPPIHAQAGAGMRRPKRGWVSRAGRAPRPGGQSKKNIIYHRTAAASSQSRADSGLQSVAVCIFFFFFSKHRWTLFWSMSLQISLSIQLSDIFFDMTRVRDKFMASASHAPECPAHAYVARAHKAGLGTRTDYTRAASRGRPE